MKKKNGLYGSVGYFRKIKLEMMGEPDEYYSGRAYTMEDASVEEILDKPTKI